MFKKTISPFQTVLMRKNLCVGCTSPLEKAQKLGKLSETKEIVQCKCQRRYIFDKDTGSFRRATFEEEQLFLNKVVNIK